MYGSMRRCLQRRSKKRLQKDFSRCFYRMLFDVMRLEGLDAALSEKEIELMGLLRRLLMELRGHIPNLRPIGFTAVLTEIKAVSKAEAERGAGADATEKRPEQDKKED